MSLRFSIKINNSAFASCTIIFSFRVLGRLVIFIQSISIYYSVRKKSLALGWQKFATNDVANHPTRYLSNRQVIYSRYRFMTYNQKISLADRCRYIYELQRQSVATIVGFI